MGKLILSVWSRVQSSWNPKQAHSFLLTHPVLALTWLVILVSELQCVPGVFRFLRAHQCSLQSGVTVGTKTCIESLWRWIAKGITAAFVCVYSRAGKTFSCPDFQLWTQLSALQSGATNKCAVIKRIGLILVFSWFSSLWSWLWFSAGLVLSGSGLDLHVIILVKIWFRPGLGMVSFGSVLV